MTGTVIKILVRVGDKITIGQDVVILESMKMQIPVEAEVAGKVCGINVNVGDFVDEDDVLLELI